MLENAVQGKQFLDLNGGIPHWLIVVIILALIAYALYFSLILKKNKVKEAFSSIDVQLKKRYDLIPNILIIANKFMEHEKTLIEEITRLRSEATKIKTDFSNVDQKIKLDTDIQSKMGQLMVNVENYPQLKSDQPMMHAMHTYNEVEEHISAARRFYNSAVLELNNAVEIWPSSMIANMLHIKQLPFFEISNEAERQRVEAKAYFS